MRSKRSDQPDQTDLRILSALQEDGRLTTNALAEKVGLSPSPCWTRVKRLEENGTIEKYVAVLDQKVLGFTNVVFVEITLDKHDDTILDRFGEALTKIPEVVEAYLVTGEYDYLVKVVVSGTDHYERFLRETLYRIPGIRQTRTTFGLRTLKRAISIDPLKMPKP
ncbi:MAG: AsnC family transcriptional regulator [Hyphomicrobiales bacterium]|nr:MAG: AsnC family transcriptional regulator [Hyphomicrobiales bacterium]